MKVMSARNPLNVTHAIGPIANTSQAPVARGTGRDNSIEGVLIFCGIGLALTIFAAIFQGMELPPPYF
jgi:hypothetical protein